MLDYQIFISYRRDGGEALAQLISERLKRSGFKTFYDVESLRSGKFDDELYRVIDVCTDVIVILPPNGLDRCINTEDWVRKEIAYAIKTKKNIIPVMMRNFEFPEELPEEINDIRYFEGITANMEYFDATFSKLISFLKRPDFSSKVLIYLRQHIVIVITILVITMLLMGFAIVHQWGNKNNQEEEVLFPASESWESYCTFLNQNYGKIIDSVYADYDNNGDSEMFALLESSDSKCELWYVDLKGAVHLTSEDTECQLDTVLQNNRVLLLVSKLYTAKNMLYVWSVKKSGVPYELPISALVDSISCTSYGDIWGYVTAYDGYQDFDKQYTIVHTGKPYYFYYDEDNDCFREYGAVEICKEDFLQFKNSENYLETLSDDGKTVSTYYFRDNDTISLNLEKKDEMGNIEYSNETYRIINGALEPLNSNGGYYLPCLISSIAVYPTDASMNFAERYNLQ